MMIWSFLWRPTCKTLRLENLSVLFPQVLGTGVIWGSGNAAVLLENLKALKGKDLLYWGDIDPEGFQILCRIRKFYPETRSLMMDKEAFSRYRHLAVPSSLQAILDLTLLTSGEKECFRYLQTLEINRLEQEKIAAEYIDKKITELISQE